MEAEKGNFIKINRSILDWEWYQDTNTKCLFLHLLLKANWKDARFKGYDVPRGSLVTSIEKLSEETGLSVRQVRTALSHLQRTGEVTSKSTNKFTIINIVKYSVFQDIEPTNRQTNRQSNDNQKANNRQSIDNQKATIEEEKEIKNNKEEKEERKAASNPSFDSVWNEIVSLYPKRSPKDEECRELYFEMVEGAEDKETFVNHTKGAIADYLESHREQNPDDESMKFIYGLKRFIQEVLPDGIKEQEKKKNVFNGWTEDGRTIPNDELMEIKTDQRCDHSRDPAFMEVFSEIYRRYPIHAYQKEVYEKAYLAIVNVYEDGEGANKLYAAIGLFMKESKHFRVYELPDLGFFLLNMAEEYMAKVKDYKKLI